VTGSDLGLHAQILERLLGENEAFGFGALLFHVFSGWAGE
jgi:hypothetical protein